MVTNGSSSTKMTNWRIIRHFLIHFWRIFFEKFVKIRQNSSEFVKNSSLFVKNSSEFVKNSSTFRQKIRQTIGFTAMNSKFCSKKSRKNDEKLQKIWGFCGAKARTTCRFWKMLQNEPTLAIWGLDTDENGPSKVRQLTNKIRPNIGLQRCGPGPGRAARRVAQGPARR